MFFSFGHRTKSGWGKRTCELIPPHQSLTRQLPPLGEAFYVIFLVRRIPTFLKVQRIQNPKSKIALSNRLPPGGKLSRQRLMRGDISALSSFDISTPVKTEPLLLIGFPPGGSCRVSD